METKDHFVGLLDGVRYYRTHQTEAYVTVPPARLITDSRGNTWTLGTEYVEHSKNSFEFNVVVNDVSTGEFASRIEYRGGRVRIFGKQGWRTWNGRTFI